VMSEAAQSIRRRQWTALMQRRAVKVASVPASAPVTMTTC